MKTICLCDFLLTIRYSTQAIRLLTVQRFASNMRKTDRQTNFEYLNLFNFLNIEQSEVHMPRGVVSYLYFVRNSFHWIAISIVIVMFDFMVCSAYYAPMLIIIIIIWIEIWKQCQNLNASKKSIKISDLPGQL